MNERWRIDPGALVEARLTPPPSKSDAQRALVLARARGGISFDLGPDEELPGDVRVLREGLRVLDERPADGVVIDCRDGGAPFRILLGQAAVTPNARVRLTGTARLGERPHGPLKAALERTLNPAGLVLEEGDPWPLVVHGAHRAFSTTFRIAASESSQYATSLLLAIAWLSAREGRMWALDLDGPTASRGYLDLTLEWLSRFGYEICAEGARIEVRKGTPPSRAPAIPGDWSSLAYLLLVAFRSGGSVAGVDRTAAHPDREILRVLSDVGFVIDDEDGAVRVRGTPSKGARASGSVCPDLLPTVAALACALPGETTLTEVSVLRHKESDRLAGIEELVRAGGGEARREGDAIVIRPGEPPRELAFDARGDHRLAMSAAVLSVLTGRPLVLDDPTCVTKSFPGFWRELGKAEVRTERLG